MRNRYPQGSIFPFCCRKRVEGNGACRSTGCSLPTGRAIGLYIGIICLRWSHGLTMILGNFMVEDSQKANWSISCFVFSLHTVIWDVPRTKTFWDVYSAWQNLPDLATGSLTAVALTGACAGCCKFLIALASAVMSPASSGILFWKICQFRPQSTRFSELYLSSLPAFCREILSDFVRSDRENFVRFRFNPEVLVSPGLIQDTP